MMVITERGRSMIKNMSRGIRMMKSAAARLRRRENKKVIKERQENFYSKMRRLRKKNVHN
jgi:flagellar biosynthesis/type III secretory pathway chaperone